jgi:hypothetical protein
MKLKHAAVLAAVVCLAACGGGKQEGDVRFLGFAPVTASQKDVRTVETRCPACGEPLAVDTNRCTVKKCKTDMTWPKEYKCPSCQGSKRCAACSAMEQSKGECYNCKGQGVLIYAGQSPVCPNCKGNKVCPICKGSQKCDYCDGEGRIGKDMVKTRAAKFVSKEGDNEPPPSDPRPPDTKKEEPEKKPETKEEPKKDGDVKDEKK